MSVPILRLELAVTERCNAKCRHCNFPTSPVGADMSAADAVRWVEEAAQFDSLRYLLIFGGEPMLNPTVTLAAIKAGKRCGIPSLDIITNGFWAANDEQAHSWARQLRAAGLDRVIFSVDIFHAEFVPVDNLKRAAQAALSAGMSKVIWNVSVFRRGEPVLPEDIRTWEIVKELREISQDINENEIIIAGRALENYGHLFPRKPGIPRDPCPGPTYATDIAHPTVLTLYPNGNIWVCWNLVAGNAKHSSLADFIRNYDANQNEIIRTLITAGPAGLLELPIAKGFKPKDVYINVCGLCQDLMLYFKRRDP